jgi:putative exporter of polyketide antibiotics
MRGLLLKSIREVWFTTLLCCLGLALIKGLLTFVLPKVLEGMDEIFEQMPFVKSIVTALLGTEIGDRITARTMQAFLWVHPVVLALVWGHEITLCTRLPAGEIDRGTIDVLLSWPISRRKIYVGESIVWLASGVLVIFMGLIGHRFAAPTMPEEMRPELSRVAIVMLNLYFVYVAVGGIAFLVSGLSDRRGRAVAIVFALLLASFLLNFVAQYWDPAKQIAFLSVMEYYQPANILNGGQFPTGNLATLFAVGGVSWLAGCEIFARRDICTL